MMTHLGYDKEQLEVAILSEMLFTILHKLKMDHHHTVERLEQELSTLNDFLPLLDARAQNQIEHHIEFFVIEDLVRIICRANRRTAIDEILSSSKFFRYILDLHRDRYYEQFDSSTRLLLWVNSNKLFCREILELVQLLPRRPFISREALGQAPKYQEIVSGLVKHPLLYQEAVHILGTLLIEAGADYRLARLMFWINRSFLQCLRKTTQPDNSIYYQSMFPSPSALYSYFPASLHGFMALCVQPTCTAEHLHNIVQECKQPLLENAAKDFWLMQVIFMDTLLHAISLAVTPSSSAEITKEAIEYVTSFLLPPFSLAQGADFKTSGMELGGMKHQEGMTKWLLDLVALIKDGTQNGSLSSHMLVKQFDMKLSEHIITLHFLLLSVPYCCAPHAELDNLVQWIFNEGSRSEVVAGTVLDILDWFAEQQHLMERRLPSQRTSLHAPPKQLLSDDPLFKESLCKNYSLVAEHAEAQNCQQSKQQQQNNNNKSLIEQDLRNRVMSFKASCLH